MYTFTGMECYFPYVHQLDKNNSYFKNYNVYKIIKCKVLSKREIIIFILY